MNDTALDNDYATGLMGVDIEAIQRGADRFLEGIYADTDHAFTLDVQPDGDDYLVEVGYEGKRHEKDVNHKMPSFDSLDKATAYVNLMLETGVAL